MFYILYFHFSNKTKGFENCRVKMRLLKLL